jgi:sulfonate transport system substrate-binding protein
MPSTRAGAVAIVSVAIATAVAIVAISGPRRTETAALGQGQLPFDAPLPAGPPPPQVTLTIGDPITQHVLEHTGWIKELPFNVKWAEISGGPAVTEAFHARVLDVGLSADIPPIHATWIGIPVKIIGVRLRQDPLGHPLFELGVAPKSGIQSLADLRGKRIAFSPGQVQGEVVLRTLQAEGLTPKDVKLVELPSSGDVYVGALAGGLVDVAPMGVGTQAKHYLEKYAADGARVLPHPPFRDDLTVLYVRDETLRDPAKAAALKAYIALWARAAEWVRAHPDEWAQTYYVADQGLSIDDARYVVAAAGEPDIPADWSEAIGMEQIAADVVGRGTGQPHLAAADLFDRRFEPVAASAAATEWAKQSAAAASRLAQR